MEMGTQCISVLTSLVGLVGWHDQSIVRLPIPVSIYSDIVVPLLVVDLAEVV